MYEFGLAFVCDLFHNDAGLIDSFSRASRSYLIEIIVLAKDLSFLALAVRSKALNRALCFSWHPKIVDLLAIG